MCGLCGIYSKSVNRELELRIRGATKTILHRGPDHNAVYSDAHVALGHARLSIVDLSPDGNQPMKCGITGRSIVFNGEIYNFQELRTELLANGYSFRSRSDTEVLLHAYDCWGDACFAKLNGIYGFAIWDPSEGALVLVRDRFGVKPLYVMEIAEEVIFGSEVKAILHAASSYQRRICRAALHEFAYYGTALGGKTLFDGITQVAPGECRRWVDGKPSIQRYWSFPSTLSEGGQAHAEIAQASVIGKTRELLENAVATQLTGEVPLGVFLSGGLDSSCITAFASKHYGGRLSTFSVGFDFNIVDELPLARRVAAHFGTEHNELLIRGADVGGIVQSLVTCHDSPFSDAANIPLYLLCKELTGKIKVVLQGDGGDEIFGGYRRYATLSNELPLRWLSQLVRTPLAGLMPDRLRRYLQCFTPRQRAERMARLLTVETVNPAPTRIFSEHVRNSLATYDPFSRYREVEMSLSAFDAVQAMLLTDMQIILPDVFLEKVDKSTMAHGIEVRVPLLENSLVDYMISLPSRVKVRHGKQKWLMREALRGVLPDFVLNAPKQGFGVPFSNWLRGPLKELFEDVVFATNYSTTHLFDLPTVRNLFDQHLRKQRDHGFLLWKTMNLALWQQQYRVSFE